MMLGTACSDTSLPLLETRVIYQWGRVEQLDQWWHWLLLTLVCIALTLFVAYWYRRDSVEQSRPVRWALLLLRIAAFSGLLLYFMQLDKRSEQQIVRDSRVAVLVDTSLSMSLPGTPSDVGVTSGQSRADEVAGLFKQSGFLQQLAQKHVVSVYRFDQLARPVEIAAVEKMDGQTSRGEPLLASGGLLPDDERLLATARRLTALALIIGACSLMMLTVALGAQIRGIRQWTPGGWLMLSGSAFALVAMAVAAFGILPTTMFPLATVFGAPLEADTLQGIESPQRDAAQNAESLERETLPEDWADALRPSGVETRLGDAIKSVLDREVGSPLAGIVVITDGRSNAGTDPRQVVAAAQNMRVPLYVIGLGSEKSPPNLQLAELDVPKRLYPGDRFALTALVGSNGFEGRMVTVQVTAGAKDADVESLGIEAEQQLLISADGSLGVAKFELEPKRVGEWQYAVKVIPLPGDANPRDNYQSALVEVIERKNQVLTVAGGPTREYQFVRNLLYRDRDVESHVLLQTASASSSQEAQEILEQFPVDRSELSQYDAILTFDTDWTTIPDRSVAALEQWVAEQAGGLVMVAGSVEMPKWIARSASGTKAQNLRSLSPVVLDQRGSSLLAAGRIEAATPWPLTITADGSQTDFMWLSDDAKASSDLWQTFDGVYSFYSAYELKPGAKALALFSDPTAAIDGQQPIYIASQFYGAGRVVFIGGSELWRLRRMGDQYFDRFYTKLVRWVSQGRLLMDSDRGVLLVDREQATLGDQVIVRAVLKNERYEPLLQSEVVARVVDPRQKNSPLVLRPLADGSQPGVYTGQLPVLLPGEYQVQLQLGGLASDEFLQATIDARIPAREMQQAERNDPLLRQLAVDTGGTYWAGVRNAMPGGTRLENSGQNVSVVDAIEPKDQIAYLPGAPDRNFQLRWLGWLMAWIAGCLSLEWLSRRLHRLA